jgi:hypothetical protein
VTNTGPGLRVAETDVSRSNAKAWLRPALATVCFAVFALAAVSLHQEKIARFVVEEEGPIPAALSHLMFGARLGFADTGALQYFKLSKASTAEEAVESAARGDVAATHDLRMPLDGIGIGPPLADTLALTLFGPHARLLLWLFLALLGISTGSYVLRFRNERLWVASVFLAALTLLLLTLAMEAPRAVAEAPLGGERSYILLAILPTLHWCFELVASKSQSRRDALFRGLLLGVQIAILGFAILVRYSPICFLPAVPVSAILALRSGLAKRGTVLCLVPLAGLMIVLYGIVPRAFPEHAASGRLQSLIWHRAFVGFNANPEWPFPGVVEQFPCPQVPAGIVRRGTDSNAHCAWFAAPMNRSRPLAEVWAELYGARYEAVLRDAFLDVATRYRGKTLATFLYYKPLMMVSATGRSLIPWPAMPMNVAALAVLQFVLLASFLAIEPASGRGVKLRTGITIVTALVLAALIPHLLAWTNPATGQELAAGVVCGAIIGVWLGCRAVLRRFSQRMPPVSPAAP